MKIDVGDDFSRRFFTVVQFLTTVVYLGFFEATHECLDTVSIWKTSRQRTQFEGGNPSAWTGSRMWSATLGVER